jgi:hypothetical protein
MTEMIERVAVAIAKVGALEPDASAKAMARAAIEAMREPTAEMLCKAVPYPLHLVVERADAGYTGAMESATMADRITARQTYYDLIDAALGDARSP